MKKILSFLLALVLCAGLSAPALAAGFSDVPSGSPFAPAVAWAVEKGITKGKAPGVFAPGEPCSKGQILTFLWRLYGSPETTVEYLFYDQVSANYRQAALWSYESGVDTTRLFGADAPCTRALAVLYIWRAQGSPAPSGTVSFTDVNPKAPWAPSVSWAVEAGVTNGTGNGTFSPEAVCTRGQIATFLYRAMVEPQKPAEEPAEEPNTLPTGNSVITVDSRPDTYGTAWVVGDNQFPTGYLNNGEPITEENVIALIETAKPLWPQGMSWSDGKETNVFAYNNAINTNTVQLQIKASMSRGCGGFAALINNYVFGQTNNPIRKLTDNSQARPGDIVINFDKKTGIAAHVRILTGYGTGAATGKSGLTYAEGNLHHGGADAPGTIGWSEETGNILLPTGLVQGNSSYYYEVWTRYPD